MIGINMHANGLTWKKASPRINIMVVSAAATSSSPRGVSGQPTANMSLSRQSSGPAPSTQGQISGKNVMHCRVDFLDDQYHIFRLPVSSSAALRLVLAFFGLCGFFGDVCHGDLVVKIGIFNWKTGMFRSTWLINWSIDWLIGWTLLCPSSWLIDWLTWQKFTKFTRNLDRRIILCCFQTSRFSYNLCRKCVLNCDFFLKRTGTCNFYDSCIWSGHVNIPKRAAFTIVRFFFFSRKCVLLLLDGVQRCVVSFFLVSFVIRMAYSWACNGMCSLIMHLTPPHIAAHESGAMVSTRFLRAITVNVRTASKKTGNIITFSARIITAKIQLRDMTIPRVWCVRGRAEMGEPTTTFSRRRTTSSFCLSSGLYIWWRKVFQLFQTA